MNEMGERSPQSQSGSGVGVERKDVRPLLFLCLCVYVLWAIWAVWLHNLQPFQRSPTAAMVSGITARALFWGGPCAVYLARVWGRRWAHPLGLGFPFGGSQVRRTLMLMFLVTWALFAATAARNFVPVTHAWWQFFTAAKLRLTAPVFEELVFRGVILSELLNWTHENSSSSWGLRVRYWAAQLGCAAFFVLIHWPAWWAHLGYEAVLHRSLPIFAVALVLGFVFAHTRSIWPCIWLHWLNNELSLMA